MSRRTHMRSTSLVAALAIGAFPAIAAAQNDETLQVFHGAKKNTIGYAWNTDGRNDRNTRLLEGRRMRRLVSSRDSVCVEVTNANKLFYEYTLVSRKDSTPLNIGIAELEPLTQVLSHAVLTSAADSARKADVKTV